MVAVSSELPNAERGLNPYGNGGRWTEARWLRLGDVFLTRTGKSATVSGLTIRIERVKVYNLHVEGLHLYAVGEAGVLVHNSGTVKVTHWGPNRAPDIRTGDWVMIGGRTPLNYVSSGVAQLGYRFRDATTTYARRADLRMPNEHWLTNWVKALLGQRRYHGRRHPGTIESE